MSSKKIMSYTRYLSINGRELSADRMRLITNITKTDSSNGSDLLAIKIVDPHLVFVEDNIFIKDVPVIFKATLNTTGYSTIFEGFISAIDVNFSEDGIVDMTIYCMDNSYIMNRNKRTRSWKEAKASSIVRDIMSKHYPSFKLYIEDTGEITKKQLEANPTSPSPLVAETTSQSDQTDMEFFLNLAGSQIEDYVCYVNRNEFHFEKRKMVQTPQATIWYKQNSGDILSFSPQINKEIKKQEVNKKQISLVTKKLSSYVANEMSVDRNLQGHAVVTGG